MDKDLRNIVITAGISIVLSCFASWGIYQHSLGSIEARLNEAENKLSKAANNEEKLKDRITSLETRTSVLDVRIENIPTEKAKIVKNYSTNSSQLTVDYNEFIRSSNQEVKK